MGNWKGVKQNIDKTPQGETELFDLSSDIGETNNVASTNPLIVKQLEKIMIQAHTPSEVFSFANEILKK
jgi:arylsulfatase A